MSYWREAIAQALCEIDAFDKFTSEEIDELGKAMEGSAENESLATGRDCIPHPLHAEVDRVQKYRREDKEEWGKERERMRSDHEDQVRSLRRTIRHLQDQLDRERSQNR